MYPSERASEYFKKGFRDCRDRRPALYLINDGTFAAFDYVEGWEACRNEMYWNAVRENNGFETYRITKGRAT